LRQRQIPPLLYALTAAAALLWLLLHLAGK
jgi:hypothetical protein